MCQRPWSNRDLFIYVNDCHIYKPAHILICALTIVFSGICLLYGVIEYFKRPRKEQPISSIVLGFFSLLNYLILVGADITYADRNFGLNLLHGIVRANIWISVGISTTRHFEVIVSVDAHTVAKSRDWYLLLNKVHTILFIFSLLLELLAISIPTFDAKIEFIDFIGPVAIILVVINSVPRCIYAWKLRKIILSIKTEANLNFYQPIQKQLEEILSSTIISVIMGFVIIMCWIFVYTIRTNLYLAYGTQLLGAPVTGIASLYSSRAVGDKAHLSHPHTEEGSSGSKARKNTHQDIHSRTPPPHSRSDIMNSSSASQDDVTPLVSHLSSHDELAQSSSQPVLPTVQELTIWNPFTVASSSPSFAPSSEPVTPITASPVMGVGSPSLEGTGGSGVQPVLELG